MKSSGARSTLSRAWDAYDAYLFDIDGTLLSCTDAVHYFAFCDTLKSLSGQPLTLEGVTAHGNTDIGILRDALKLAKVDERNWRPRIAESRQAMCRYVSQRKDDLRTTVMPGVAAVLSRLQDRGAILGVATGNLEGIGRLKLESAGLSSYFQFAGYSDDFEYRTDVFRSAIAKAHSLAGPSATICAIGDTPADVQAARQNGLEVIAVATGPYSFEILTASEPDLCLSSLEELLNRP